MPDPPTTAAPGPGSRTALVGRHGELERLAALLAPGRAGALLHGEAGVGKSRLAREALAAAASRGAVTHWVQATASASGVPLAAYASLLPDGIASGELLPALQRAVAGISERAEGAPVVVAVDDAHALDPVSATLTLQLAQSGAATVLATVRSGETVPDAITSLWKDAGAERIEVGTLSQTETAAVVEAMAGGPVSPGTKHWAHATSGGNALYLRELITGVLAGGGLVEQDGVWRMTRLPEVSASLRELITARMVGLGEAEQLVVELLAVGEPLRDEELAGLAGFEALERLERRGLIVAGDAADVRAVRLSHPLYAEVVAAGLGRLRRRARRLQVAELLRARPQRTEPEALRVATWLLEAGVDVDPQDLISAAWAATSSGDPELGVTLAGDAVRAGLVEGSIVLGRSLHLAGRPEEAVAAYAAIDPARIDSPKQAIRAAQHHANVLALALGRRAEARAAVRRIADGLPAPDWREQVAALELLWQDLGEQDPAELAATRAALAAHRLPADLRDHFEPAEALALHAAGRCREAFAAIRTVDFAVPLRGHHDELALAAWAVIGGESGEDHPLVAVRMARAFERAVQVRDHAAGGVAATSLALRALSSGRLDDASRWAAEGRSRLLRRELLGALLVATSVQVSVAATQGDFAAASAFVARMHEEAARDHGVGVLPPYGVIAEARAARAGGDAPRARALLLAGMAQPGAGPMSVMSMLHEALHAGEPAARLLPLLSDAVDSRRADAIRRHVRAAAAGDGAELLAAAEDLEALGNRRDAIEAATGAAGAFLAAGRQDSARRAAARAHELFELGQGGVAPRIDGLDRAAVGLTRREQSIVDLVREGLSNAAIAERLVLSVRTVESHVYRASQKLGVRDRHDL